ncbi:MAG: hypothetical protein WC522_07690 [Candidatus Omnitrophota bacterium]
MVKVKCIKCGNIGFTAAPHFVRCGECGGRHRILPYRRFDFQDTRVENRILAFSTAKRR